MPKTKKRSDGRCEVTKVIDGKLRHFYGRTMKEARDRQDEAIRESGRAKDAPAQLFEDAAREWWLPWAASVKPGSIRGYKAAQAKALREFSGYTMTEITPGMVVLWLKKLGRQGYAQSTVKNCKSCLSLIFEDWCVRTGSLYNPCTVAKVPRGLPVTEREPPTEEQLSIVRAHPEGFGIAAWLFWYTGARLGEVVALQWRDVDFEAGIIHVTKSVYWDSNQPLIVTTKTKNGTRDVPLLSPLRAQLEPRRGDPDAYILGGAEKPLTQNRYARAWEGYCREVGLAGFRVRKERHRGKEFDTQVTVPLVTAHQFRHEMASVLYEAGVGIMEAQRILGHADIVTTQRIYTHLRARQMDDAAAKTEALTVS